MQMMILAPSDLSQKTQLNEYHCCCRATGQTLAIMTELITPRSDWVTVLACLVLQAV